MITLASARAAHAPAIERLLDDAFDPERWQKTCQRLRDGQAPPGATWRHQGIGVS